MATTRKSNRRVPAALEAAGTSERLKFATFHFFTQNGYVWYRVGIDSEDPILEQLGVTARLGERPCAVWDDRTAAAVTKAAGRAWRKLHTAKIAEPSFLWEKKAVKNA